MSIAMMHGVEKDVATMVSGVKHVLGRLCDSTATRLVFRANSTMMQAMPTWCIERTQRALGDSWHKSATVSV